MTVSYKRHGACLSSLSNFELPLFLSDNNMHNWNGMLQFCFDALRLICIASNKFLFEISTLIHVRQM